MLESGLGVFGGLRLGVVSRVWLGVVGGPGIGVVALELGVAAGLGLRLADRLKIGAVVIWFGVVGKLGPIMVLAAGVVGLEGAVTLGPTMPSDLDTAGIEEQQKFNLHRGGNGQRTVLWHHPLLLTTVGGPNGPRTTLAQLG
ncbi:hypothetical protein MRX96_034992 [Rhipicephalus microplus]